MQSSVSPHLHAGIRTKGQSIFPGRLVILFTILKDESQVVVWLRKVWVIAQGVGNLPFRRQRQKRIRSGVITWNS